MVTAQLRLLETTDLHMQIDGFDYILNRNLPYAGWIGLAGLINRLRNEDVETLLFDNGDFLQGSPLADVAIADLGHQDHPMVAGMNALEYDAIALGNHEFDYGLEKLQAITEALDAPVLSANIRRSPTEYLATPWTILERTLKCSDDVERTIKIGVIGFVTPQVVEWNSHELGGQVLADDIVAAAFTHLPAIRRNGADIIVALAHTGIGAASHEYGMENVAQPLAAMRGLDVLLLGHTHDIFPDARFAKLPGADLAKGTLFGTPTVMASAHGKGIGQIDLGLRFHDGDWSIESSQSELRRPEHDDAEAPQQVKHALAKALPALHEKTIRLLDEPVGRTTTAMTTYFSTVGYDPTLRLTALALTDEVQTALIGTEFSELPVIGATASFRTGGRKGPDNYLEIDAGPITARHIAALSPFDNAVCGVLRRGWQIREWLMAMSGFFNVIEPSKRQQILQNYDFPAYHFDILEGLNYSFDLSQPLPDPSLGPALGLQNQRVTDIRYKGQDIQDDDLFVIATTTYRATGGGMMGNVGLDDIIYRSGSSVKTTLQKWLPDHLSDQRLIRRNWTFAPLGGTEVKFRSSHSAVPHIPAPSIHALDEQDTEGYRLFSISI